MRTIKKVLLIIGAITVPLIPYLYLRKYLRAAALFGVAIGLGFVTSAVGIVIGGLDDRWGFAVANSIGFGVNVIFRIWLVFDVLRIAKQKEAGEQAKKQASGSDPLPPSS